jgi:hypothetical protein
VYTQGYNDGLENDEYEDDEEIELVDDDEEGDEDDA